MTLITTTRLTIAIARDPDGHVVECIRPVEDRALNAGDAEEMRVLRAARIEIEAAPQGEAALLAKLKLRRKIAKRIRHKPKCHAPKPGGACRCGAMAARRVRLGAVMEGGSDG